MKIAVVTEDGKTISAHFGRAPCYMIVTVENGTIVAHEMRQKPAHGQFASPGGGLGCQSRQNASDERGHGFGAQAQSRHIQMIEPISDCEALICRGMGQGAYQNLKSRGIRPVLTDLLTIDEAVLAYVEGRIVDHPEWLH